MRFTLIAFLPSLGAAVDYQITNWVCTALLDVKEGMEMYSVRDYGESGCDGYTLYEKDDGSYSGTFSGNTDSDTAFVLSEDPNVPDKWGFSATFSDNSLFLTIGSAFRPFFRHGTHTGECVPARGNSVCQTFSTACAIGVVYDCTFTD